MKKKATPPPPAPVPSSTVISSNVFQIGPSKVDGANEAAVAAMKAIEAMAKAVETWARYAPVVVDASNSNGLNMGGPR